MLDVESHKKWRAFPSYFWPARNCIFWLRKDLRKHIQYIVDISYFKMNLAKSLVIACKYPVLLSGLLVLIEKAKQITRSCHIFQGFRSVRYATCFDSNGLESRQFLLLVKLTKKVLLPSERVKNDPKLTIILLLLRLSLNSWYTNGQFHQHIYSNILHTQIPIAQTNSQVITFFLRF